MKRVLITGANGQLGNSIRRIAPRYPELDFLYTDVDTLDICDERSLADFVSGNAFEVIVNCAAYTAVDKAESDRDAAIAINEKAVVNLVSVSRKTGAFLIHISTDYVLDGRHHLPYTESDKTSPLSFYGLSKLKGEEAIFNAGSQAIIIRTSWLYSEFGHNFLKTMLRMGKEKSEIGVVFDQVGTPTYASDLAQVILDIIGSDPKNSFPELYHYSNEGVASWYDFAVSIMEDAGLPCKVKPILTSDFPTPAYRPAYSLLSKQKIKAAYGLEIPHWRDGLKRCLVSLKSIN